MKVTILKILLGFAFLFFLGDLFINTNTAIFGYDIPGFHTAIGFLIGILVFGFGKIWGLFVRKTKEVKNGSSS